MPNAEGAFLTYETAIRKEDVSELISNVSIRKTPFVSSIGMGSASNTLHEVLTDEYASAADNAQLEGSDPTYPTLSDPSRVKNITQILSRPLQLSWSKINSAHYGMSDNFAYQKVKQTVALKKDLELAALFGTQASGTGTAARRMNGLVACISSYKDGSSYSGVALSATIFNAVAAALWDQSEENGGTLLVGSFQKRRISENFSSFDSSNRRNISAGDRTVEIPIDTIHSDFGTFEVLPSHDMQTVIPSALIAYKPEFHKIAYLTNSQPQAVEYPPTGKARKGEVWTECTLECSNEKTSGMILNLATA